MIRTAVFALCVFFAFDGARVSAQDAASAPAPTHAASTASPAPVRWHGATLRFRPVGGTREVACRVWPDGTESCSETPLRVRTLGATALGLGLTSTLVLGPSFIALGHLVDAMSCVGDDETYVAQCRASQPRVEPLLVAGSVIAGLGVAGITIGAIRIRQRRNALRRVAALPRPIVDVAFSTTSASLRVAFR